MVYTIGTSLLGLIIGLSIGIGPLSKTRVLNVPLRTDRAVPLHPAFVQLVWFYYVLPLLISMRIPPNVAAVTALSLYTRAFYAEIFLNSIVFIERRPWDACGGVSMNYVVGLTGPDARG